MMIEFTAASAQLLLKIQECDASAGWRINAFSKVWLKKISNPNRIA
jgi:hypothetical protein